MSVRCPKCGSENLETADYCVQCVTPLRAEETILPAASGGDATAGGQPAGAMSHAALAELATRLRSEYVQSSTAEGSRRLTTTERRRRIILGDTCPVCRAASQLSFSLDHPPQIPIIGCSEPEGCRCSLPDASSMPEAVSGTWRSPAGQTPEAGVVHAHISEHTPPADQIMEGYALEQASPAVPEAPEAAMPATAEVFDVAPASTPVSDRFPVRLESFRVQNYKKIRDTGWIACDDLTAFFGKNESGKSAIFRGLSKLNPSEDQLFDPLREFPRRRFASEFHSQDWPVVSARFLLNAEGRDQLAELCPALGNVGAIEVTRSYSWNLNVTFDPPPDAAEVTADQFRSAVDGAMEDIQDLLASEGKGEALAAVKQAVLGELRGVRDEIPAEPHVSKAEIDPAVAAITIHTNEEWQRNLFTPVLESLRAFARRAAAAEGLEKARAWTIEHLPRFVYFDNYDVLDSAIHIPTFLSQLAATPDARRVRTVSCLFRQVGLDTGHLAALGHYGQGQEQDPAIRREIDERAILTSSASNAMTEQFSSWWEQRRLKFRYQLDGDYFRIWVSDDLDPSEIELDQRSAGMQYFFSLFTVFLVEATAAHSNSILLLDEPGLHLHSSAQQKLVQFLDEVTQHNQTLYSSHSPFMVDVKHLERVRLVYEGDDGTTAVAQGIWPKDRDSLFPLQAAVAYELARGLFAAKRQIIVEGLAELWLFEALSQALAATGRTGLRREISIVPAGGAARLVSLASIMGGRGLEVVALLGGDEPARMEGQRLASKVLSATENRCLFIGDFLDKRCGGVEDLFPEDEYLAAVMEAYPDVEPSFRPDEDGKLGIATRVQQIFMRKGLQDFERSRPARILRDRILAAPGSVSPHTATAAERIFQACDALLA